MSRHTLVVTWVGAALGGLATFGGVVEFSERLFALFADWSGMPIDQLPHGDLLALAAVILLVLVGATLVALLARVSQHALSPHPAPATDSETARERVRRRYLEFMRREIAGRLSASIHHAVIELQPVQRHGAAKPWYTVAHVGSDPPRTFTDFHECFETFEQRLLLLGDPGSGKSTTLLLLAERLVADALADPGAPVPLLESLSQFQDFPAPKDPAPVPPKLRRLIPARNEDHWLQARLATLIGDGLPVEGLNAQTVSDWIDAGHVVLLLDGLDEVEEGRRAALADCLNTTLFRQHPNTPTVVASRIIEYRVVERDPDKRLRLAGAVTLQPLRDEQIDAYLEAAGAAGLRQVLPDDSALKELSRTPLTLSMMTLAYQGLTAEDIRAQLTHTDRRTELFDRFVDRMMQRDAWRRRGEPWDPRSPEQLKTPYSRAQVNRYLGWLATALSQRAQTRFDPRRLPALLAIPPVTGPRPWHAPFVLGSLAALILYTGLAGALVAIVSGGFWSQWPVMVTAVCCGLCTDFFSQRCTEKAEGPRRGNPTGPLRWLFIFLLAAFPFSLWLAAASATIAVPSRIVLLALALVPLFALLVIFRNFLVTGILVLAALSVILPYWFHHSGLTSPLLPPIDLDEIPFGVASLVAALAVGAAFSLKHVKSAWRSTLTTVVAYTVLFLPMAMVAEAIGATVPGFHIVGHPIIVAGFIGTGFGLFLYKGHVKGLGLTLFAMLAGTPGQDLATIAATAGIGAIIAVAIAIIGQWKYWFLIVKNHAAVISGVLWVEELSRRLLLYPIIGLVLRSLARIPWRTQRFFNYATDVLLLRRTGPNHEFMHLLLRAHFAVRAEVPRLKAKQAMIRIAAIRRLGGQGEAALETLDPLTRDEDPHIRLEAVRALAGVPSDKVGAHLAMIWRSESDAGVKLAAVEGIARLPEREADPLLKGVQVGERDRTLRMAAVRVHWQYTGRVKSEGFLSCWKWRFSGALFEFARDPDPEIRLCLIREGVRDKEYSNYVRDMLLDSDERVSRASLLWLILRGQHQTKEGTLVEQLASERGRQRLSNTVLDLLVGPGADDRFRNSRTGKWYTPRQFSAVFSKQVLPAVCRLAGEWGLGPAQAQLADLLRHRHGAVRTAAATALGRLATDECIEDLLELFRERKRAARRAALAGLAVALRQPARAALSATAMARASEAIVAACGDPDAFLRGTAVRALPYASVDNRAPLLQRAASDPRRKVRIAVAAAMVALDPDGFAEDLMRLLADRPIQKTVAETLKGVLSAPLVARLCTALDGPDRNLRMGAVIALGVMQIRAAVPALLALMQRLDNERGRAGVWNVWRPGQRRRLTQERVLCAKALVRIGDPAVLPDLDAALYQDEIDTELEKAVKALRARAEATPQPESARPEPE